MERIKKRLLLLLLASFGTWPSFSSELTIEDIVYQLNQLLNDKQYELAYQFADEYTIDMGGEPSFDLMLGLAAYGSGKFQEAVFAFERVVINMPSSYLGRLYLARSYGKVKNLDAALIEVERLQAQALNEQQRETVDDLQDRLNNRLNRRGSTWYHTFALNLVQDSNVNSGTDDDLIVLPNGTEIPLFDSAKSASDSGYQIKYVGGYQQALNQKQRFNFELNASHVGYSEYDQFDRQQLGFKAQFQQDVMGGKFSIDAYTQPLWLQLQLQTNTVQDFTDEPETETKLYRIDSGMRTSYQKGIGQRTSVRVGADYAWVVNEVSPELDHTRAKLSLGVQYQGEWFHGFNLHWQQDTTEDSEREHLSKDVLGAAYQFSIPYSGSLLSSHFVLVEQHEFAEIHPVFEKTRSETLILLSNQGIYRLTESQQVKATLNYQYKDSNIDLFKYDRLEAGLGWQIRF